MKSSVRIALTAVAAYAGMLLWQLAMRGTVPANPEWYLTGVPVALVIGVVASFILRGRAG